MIARWSVWLDDVVHISFCLGCAIFWGHSFRKEHIIPFKPRQNVCLHGWLGSRVPETGSIMHRLGQRSFSMRVIHAAGIHNGDTPIPAWGWRECMRLKCAVLDESHQRELYIANNLICKQTRRTCTEWRVTLWLQNTNIKAVVGNWIPGTGSGIVECI